MNDFCWCGQDARVTHSHAGAAPVVARRVDAYPSTFGPPDARDVLLERAVAFLVLAEATERGERFLNPEALRAFLASPELAAWRTRKEGRGER